MPLPPTPRKRFMRGTLATMRDRLVTALGYVSYQTWAPLILELYTHCVNKARLTVSPKTYEYWSTTRKINSRVRLVLEPALTTAQACAPATKGTLRSQHMFQMPLTVIRTLISRQRELSLSYTFLCPRTETTVSAQATPRALNQ